LIFVGWPFRIEGLVPANHRELLRMSDNLQYFKEKAAMIDEIMRRDLALIDDPDLSAVLDDALFAGGKRVRPLLNLLAAAAVKGCPVEELDRRHQELAISFEYLHVASLVHDDIIDSSDTRRGRPAIWKAHSPAAAILAGDHLHARAMTLAGTAGGPECLAVIGAATQAMVESEFIQMRIAGRIDTNEEQYLAVLRGKTAALISAACECGVIAAGGSAGERKSMAEYGSAIGLAFQMADDLLDYNGDPGKTGKAVGNDLAEGKMTMPVIYALGHAAEKERRWLAGLLSVGRAEREESFTAVRAMLGDSGAFAATAAAASSLVDEAVTALALYGDSLPARALVGLAQYVISLDR